MKKSELKTGMRVVHGKHVKGNMVGIVILDLNKICFKDGGFNYLSSYSEDLKNSYCWDITEVYDIDENFPLSFILDSHPIYWVKEKKAEQIQLEIVMDRIAELQQQANTLKEIIESK